MKRKVHVSSLKEQLLWLPDPRQVSKVRFALYEVLMLVILASISGMRNYKQFETFAIHRQADLREHAHLPLANGVPTCYTFRRILSVVSSELLETCYRYWAAQQFQDSHTGRDHVAIDGKTMRGSAYPASDLDPLHVVSAWVDSKNLCLGQLIGTKKNSEIVQIPKLIQALKLKGCVVSIDAIACQRDIADTLCEQGADYVLMVKNNQPRLLEELEVAFDIDVPHLDNIGAVRESSVDIGHGRKELREYTLLTDLEYLQRVKEFAGVKSIAKVTRRILSPNVNTRDRVDVRYYITSLSGEAALAEFVHATRGHWGIENRCHWTLDVTFREDACKVHNRVAASNLSLIRKIALNALRRIETRTKDYIPHKMLSALLDFPFLLRVADSISL